MSSKDPVETLLKKTQEADVCMFTTTEDDGRLVSRPMAIQDIEDDHTIWFMTRVDTPAMREATGGQQVNVTVAEKGFWASISGTAMAVQDIDRKKEYWSKTTEAFFGDAKPEDPEVVLLKVTPQSGQYWDSPGLPAMAVEMIKGLKGDDKAARPGETKEVEL
ncbi:pyridoxamine 5'-phosphate oxidase family protein [Enteractinococcus fodinae]|uniref:General stress protein 26 n=1 Tax=Enteractinococcus fodinae TaxID=684663 RepID=A0ABU2B1P3_9MICC|nr:pyridoxamine 5'-phosphate oxidase family protein [Enteractinococcus fodinae]MDR7346954.1 general stress protein 26 [Enteractinococcus fodinae]